VPPEEAAVCAPPPRRSQVTRRGGSAITHTVHDHLTFSFTIVFPSSSRYGRLRAEAEMFCQRGIDENHTCDVISIATRHHVTIVFKSAQPLREG
jgi:hypothetical protein